MLIASAPAIYEVARAGADLVQGARITLRFDLENGRVVAVHVTPGIKLDDDKTAFWRALDDLFR